MRRAFKTGSTRYEEPKRWFPRAGRCWCSRFAKPVQHSGATHEERLGKRNWSTGAPRLTPYVHACGGGNRWCRNSVIVGGPGADGCPAECQQDRPQEEPDGEPDRGSAQVLRGVVRRCRGRRAGRIFHGPRRLPQYPAGAGHRQGGHREQHRVVHPPWRARHRGYRVPRHQHRSRRSEEHTSELQSPCNLVCRLLLEKKKQKKITKTILRTTNKIVGCTQATA